MRITARNRDDADVIRARLRALLAEERQGRGWVPDDEPTADPEVGDADEEWDDEAESGETGPDSALPAGLGRHRAPGRTARLDPGRPGAWALWTVALLAAAALIGWTWLDRPAVDQVPATVPAGVSTSPTDAPTGAPTPVNTPTAAPEAAAATVVVSVVGQVAAPGLVTLPAGSRVADALAAAGGLLPAADPASINAAAVLADGQQVAVGVPGAVQPVSSGTASAGGGGGPLDLNAATVADLDALPGIGPVLAQRIVDHRTEHGPFTSVDQLDDVSGIGPAIFAELADQVRV